MEAWRSLLPRAQTARTSARRTARRVRASDGYASGTVTVHGGRTAGVWARAIVSVPTGLALCATRRLYSMPDRSKREAKRAEIGRKFEEAKSKERSDNLVRCRACRKSR